MPATAGRVRMPANNRVHSSAALQTHGIWQSAIGYDPYAPTNKEESKDTQKSADPENAYASFQGLLALARITGSNNDEARGACKKCGRVGHLTFQCRNFLSVKEDREKDPEAIEAAVMSGLEKIKGSFGKGEVKKGEESSEEEEEESESSDSEVDSEIERIIAERNGKKVSSKGKSSSRKKKRDADSDEDESDSDSGDRRRRQRSKKRRVHKRRGSSDSDEEEETRRKRKKERRRRKRDDDESSDEDDGRRRHKRKSRKEKRRRRSRRHDSDSGASEDSGDRRQKRRNKVAASSDSDAIVSGDDNSRPGRGSLKRSEKKSRNHLHRHDE